MSSPTVTVTLSTASVPNAGTGTPATPPLTPKQIDSVMQNVTINALSIPVNLAAFSAVRIGWQQQGAPGWKISEDVAFVRSTEEDDQYDRIRDEEMDPNTADQTGNTLIDVVSYTRVWRVFWTFYGPNAFDHCRLLKSALLQPAQAEHDLLVEANLYLVTELMAPKRVPELYDEQWWERVDFEAMFNEAVQEQTIIGTVNTVPVIVEQQGSQQVALTGYNDGGYNAGGFGSNQ